MYNYRLTLKDNFVASLNNFEKMVITIAERKAEVNALLKKYYTEKEQLMVEATAEGITEEELTEKVEKIASLEEVIKTTGDAWTEELKGYNLKLFGGKDADGNKVGGYCDWISNNIYKAYVKYIDEGNIAGLYSVIADMLATNSVEGLVRDRAVQEFTSELIMLLGAKFVTDKKILKNKEEDKHSYICAMNKRAFKKLVFGAIITIIDKTTIKVENKDA